MTFEQWFDEHYADWKEHNAYKSIKAIAQASWHASLQSSDTVIERKIKARDVHNELIDKYDLQFQNGADHYAQRKLLETLAGVE